MSDASAPAAPTAAPTTESAPAAPSGEQQAPTAAEVKAEAKRKARINGREVEVSDAELPAWLRDAIGEDGALETYRLNRAAHERMQQAAEERKRIEQAKRDLLENPIAVLEKLHGREKARALMEARYAEYLEDDRITPEERAQREKETDLQRRERLIREREEKIEAQQKEAAAAQWRERFQADIPAALAEAKLPKSPKVLAQVVDRMLDALRAGEPISPKRAAMDVREEMRDVSRALFGEVEPEALEELLGAEQLKRLRKHDVAKLKAAQPRQPTGKYAPPASKKAAPKQKLTAAEFFARRRDGR